MLNTQEILTLLEEKRKTFERIEETILTSGQIDILIATYAATQACKDFCLNLIAEIEKC